jgi:hypothetical protein
MKLFITIIAFCVSLTAARAQYAPQAGVTGSTAIHAGSSSFVGWATSCTVQRGYMDIADPGGGVVSAGTDNNGTGAANQTIVSLGDSGIATLTFAASLYDGPGADFAVFENGFANPQDPEMAFLELAFVEVSSDGVNYHRFEAHSLTPITTQIPMAGVFMDAKLINNLAGKYISNYGTPFDLSELSGTTGLDIMHITHIRLVDVVGALSSLHASFDTANNIINDPYATDFATGGFDLDAVGAIHQNSTFVTTVANRTFSIYPNPVSDKLTIRAEGKTLVRLMDITGKVLITDIADRSLKLDLTTYPAGMYYLQLQDENGAICVEKIVKQ